MPLVGSDSASSSSLPTLAARYRASPDTTLSIALLYQVILGRSPDAEGLLHYSSEAARGRGLRRIAASLLASEEYARRGVGPNWRRDLYLCAGLRERRPALFETPARLACKLVREPSLRARASLVFDGRDQILRTEQAKVAGAAAACLAQIYAAARVRGSDDRDYVPLLDLDVEVSRAAAKLIAFYLPQYHPIAENDAWWGRGFTEWTNVSKAAPQFVGHYQPHLPGELGFYDLRLVEVQRRQIELARKYGIGGFCYYHYWFAGKRLLETPLSRVLRDPTLDFPFCVCWANENWTRRWDGRDSDILIEQQYSTEHDLEFISDLAPTLRDARYIRVDGRPLLLVYRPLSLPDPRATAELWRRHCRAAGIGEIYLAAVRSFEDVEPDAIGFDAAVEFPPMQARCSPINSSLSFANSDYRGAVFDYTAMASQFMRAPAVSYPLIRGVCPGWDNEARRPGRGVTYHGSTPIAYFNWLSSSLRRAVDDIGKSPPLVFINAWNEWGEGAHLEPDRRFGYAYLHATASALQETASRDPKLTKLIEETQSAFRRSQDGAVIVHLFYEDLLPEVIEHVARATDMDILVSLGPNIHAQAAEALVSRFPHVRLSSFPNRGRDVLPFLGHVRLMMQLGYRYGCKIHTKRSPHRPDGTELRERAFSSLLGSGETIRKARSLIEGDPEVGLLAARQSILDLANPEYHGGNGIWLDRVLERMERGDLIGSYAWRFVAGTMFWFKVDALRPLHAALGQACDFEPEIGQTDGTLAHAIERLIGLSCTEAQLQIRTLD